MLHNKILRAIHNFTPSIYYVPDRDSGI